MPKVKRVNIRGYDTKIVKSIGYIIEFIMAVEMTATISG